MSKRAIKEGGYPLPDQIDGYDDFVCYRVDVPNSLEYRAAFLGALSELTKWWNWEKSGVAGDTRATRAASYWRELLLDFPDCESSMFDIRQKTGFPCVIEKTYDGSTWEDSVFLNRCPVKIRITGGIVQWFNPETGVWENTAGGDEREDGDAPTPWPYGTVPPGEDGACLTAENITAFYQTCLTQVRSDIELGRNVTAIAAGLTGLASVFIPGSIFGAIALSICTALLALGTSGLDDMLQQSHLDNFKCVIHCNVETDGSVTAADFTAIRAGMSSWAGSIELEIIQNWLDGFGSVGLTRQGRAAGITAGDCNDCDCDKGSCGLYVFNGDWRKFAIDQDGTRAARDPLWELYASGAYMTAGGIHSVNHFTESGDVAGLGVFRVLDDLLVKAPAGIEHNITARRVQEGNGTIPNFQAQIAWRTNGTSWTISTFNFNGGFDVSQTLHIPNMWGAGTIVNEIVVGFASNAYSTNPIVLEQLEIICQE